MLEIDTELAFDIDHRTSDLVTALQAVAELPILNADASERLCNVQEKIKSLSPTIIEKYTEKDPESNPQTPLTDEQVDLFMKHLGIAYSIAYRYKNSVVDIEDLKQVCATDLVAAVRRFDPEIGVEFPAFAFSTIAGGLKRYFRDKTWAVKVPRPIKDKALLAKKAQRELTNALQRDPTLEEISEATHLTVDEIIESQRINSNYITDSLDRSVNGEDTGATVGETVADTSDPYEAIDVKILLEAALSKLPQRQAFIIRARAGMSPFETPLSQLDISQIIGVSQMHVSRLESAALTSMREMLNVSDFI